MLSALKTIVEHTFHRRRRWFGEDVCDLIGPVFVDGGSAGDSVTLSAVASGIDCYVEEISGGKPNFVTGGEAVIASHRIELKESTDTLAITPEYRIRVHARDGQPERVFEKCVKNASSYAPLVVIDATLVKQGFQ